MYLSRYINMRQRTELHIVIDQEGIKSVQIVGNAENQNIGHELYLKIHHLIPDFDQKIQRAIRNQRVGDLYEQ